MIFVLILLQSVKLNWVFSVDFYTSHLRHVSTSTLLASLDRSLVCDRTLADPGHTIFPSPLSLPQSAHHGAMSAQGEGAPVGRGLL